MNQSRSNPEYSGSAFVGGVRRGYRVWRVNFGQVPGPMLSSYSQAGGWPSAQITARCLLNHEHASPSKYCHCGIYAKYNLHRVEKEMRGPVYGAIDASGLVLEGSKGFRAQYATIRGLWLSHGFTHRSISSVLAALVEAYRVPVFRSPKELLEAFPPDADVAEDYILTGKYETDDRPRAAVQITMEDTGTLYPIGNITMGGTNIGTSARAYAYNAQLYGAGIIDKKEAFKLLYGSD